LVNQNSLSLLYQINEAINELFSGNISVYEIDQLNKWFGNKFRGSKTLVSLVLWEDDGFFVVFPEKSNSELKLPREVSLLENNQLKS